MPDVWIPVDSLWSQRYNQMAAKYDRRYLSSDTPLAQSPLVLIARSDKNTQLSKQFPQHLITSWSALASAVNAGVPGHLGLPNPQKSGAGAVALYSMALEWATSHGKPLAANVANPALWNWLASFEKNAPGNPDRTDAMVKDMVLGTTDRYWWCLAYESDALNWMSQGKALEIYYLPHTDYADHPYCYIDRVGVAPEALQARVSFEKYLRSDVVQKSLLRHGFRPTEISIDTPIPGNPFINATFRHRGARITNLPTEERIDYSVVNALSSQWAKRYHN
jgi:hypothetical protein